MNTLFHLLLAALLGNLIFTRALGMSTLAVSAKSKTDLIGVGLSITLFSTLGSALTCFCDRFLLRNNTLLLPLVYVLVLGLLYVLVLVLLYSLGQGCFHRFRKYIHLSVFNCAVLGTMLLNREQSATLPTYLLFGLESGLGFLLASCILKIVYPFLTSERVPTSVRGYPAILLYIGILAMALSGISQ